MKSFLDYLNEVDASQVGAGQFALSPFSTRTDSPYSVEDAYTPNNAEIESILNDLQKTSPGFFFWLKRDVREAVFQTAFIKAARSAIANNLQIFDKRVFIMMAQTLKISFAQCKQLADEHKVLLHNIASQMMPKGQAA